MICPHCNVHIHVDYKHMLLPVGDGREFWCFYAACPHCSELIARLSWAGTDILVFPKASGRPVPPEVTGSFAEDYREASLILELSPKASAALSRRCLQNIIHDKAGIKKQNLSEEIDALIESGLPSALADNLHAVRKIGNFAAHPTKYTHTGQIVNVEPDEAEWMLEVLDGLFDHFFVQPARNAGRLAMLNQKLKAAGKKH